MRLVDTRVFSTRMIFIVVLAHAYAPFAVLPIFVSLEKVDRSLLEASPHRLVVIDDGRCIEARDGLQHLGGVLGTDAAASMH